MMRGQYRDAVRDTCGRLAFDSGWSCNTIVNTAWLVVAGLLKNELKWRGIQFWAVGTGSPEWDLNPVAADPKATQLFKEIRRLRIPREQIIYLDAGGAESPEPTTRIEIRASLTWPEKDQTLREFGLFGGNASPVRIRGCLINYVVHPRIDLPAGATLTRRLRLSFHPEGGPPPQWLDVPWHWMADSPARDLNGVGSHNVQVLADAGIQTIGECANTEPTALSDDLPLMKMVELCAKARLLLRTAAALSSIPELFEMIAEEIIAIPAAELAADAGVSEERVAHLREQVSVLQLALDNRVLRGVTIKELVQNPWNEV